MYAIKCDGFGFVRDLSSNTRPYTKEIEEAKTWKTQGAAYRWLGCKDRLWVKLCTVVQGVPTDILVRLEEGLPSGMDDDAASEIRTLRSRVGTLELKLSGIAGFLDDINPIDKNTPMLLDQLAKEARETARL